MKSPVDSDRKRSRSEEGTWGRIPEFLVPAPEAETNRTRGWSLRQAVERLVGVAIRCPIAAKCAEVLVEGTVLLGKKNNVIDG